jgi:hypothetical protein
MHYYSSNALGTRTRTTAFAACVNGGAGIRADRRLAATEKSAAAKATIHPGRGHDCLGRYRRQRPDGPGCVREAARTLSITDSAVGRRVLLC